MCQYKIVCLKNHFQNMVNIYPDLACLLYTQAKDNYETKQIEQLFNPIGEDKEKILNLIMHREDYSYYHGIHTIHNLITEEKIDVRLNEYDIEVHESGENYVVFDMIKGISKNFCMIKP